MVNAVRVIVGIGGLLLMIGGLAGAVAGAWADGVWAAVTGAVILVAVVLERARYRSEVAEHDAGQSGAGGGERTMPTAPFRPTDELFIDPTSGARLRVYLDATTGERRYYAEEPRPGS